MVGSGAGIGPPSTMRDVAARAAVSIATVSRVLSGRRPADDELARRVREAAAELHFRPNPAAQGLRRPVATIGVVVPDLGNPYFAGVLKGIHAAAEKAGQRMVVAETDEHADEEVRLVHDLTRWAAGIVLCSPRMPRPELAALAATVERPLVTVNRSAPGRPSVVCGFAAGIRDICAHLTGLGHRHLAYLGGPPASWSDGERRRALRAEGRHGLRVDLLPCGPGTSDGYRATDAALATGATAVVAYSDHVALGVLIRTGELGVRIPGDVSLTGFDDIPVSSVAGPGLTTAATSTSDLGRCAHGLLTAAGARRVRVPLRLVVRGSTGPAPPR